MKSNYIFKNKNNSEKWHYFKFLHISLSSGFIEDSWILISAFVLCPLKYIVLIGVYEENSSSHKYVVGKGGFILISSSDNGGYSPLILHQNLTIVFQRLLSVWNLKPCLWIFHTLILKATHLPWTLNGTLNLLSIFLFVFCSNSMPCSWEDYQFTELHKFSKDWHISLYNMKKISFVNMITDLHW